MTTNTSANPLVSPPQRMRLDDQPDIVFQDAPSSPTRLTIDHIAGMIRDQNREQKAREQRSGAEIRERIEEMERRMMNVLDSSHGGDGSGEHVGDAGDSDPETNVDLERSGLDADPGDTPADGMVTSPSPRNDTPEVVSRYENKIDDEIIEVMTKTSSIENWKKISISQGILPYPLIYIWNCIFNGSTQALDSSDFQSQTPPQDLNKDMESSVSLIGLEIIWVFKGGGIGTWWIGTLL